MISSQNLPLAKSTTNSLSLPTRHYTFVFLSLSTKATLYYYNTMIRIVTAIVCLSSTISAAALRNNNNQEDLLLVQQEQEQKRELQRRGNCPTILPEHGSSCRRRDRLPACDYDFINVPLTKPGAGGKTLCTGASKCEPVTQCNCVKGKWDCEIHEIASCEGNVPLDSFEACNRDSVPGQETKPQEEEAPPKEIFVQPAVSSCPVTRPKYGDTCDFPDYTIACPYQHSNIPVYAAMGDCVPDALQCVPLTSCECLGGEWVCMESTLARCRNEEPVGAWTPCTPP